MSLKPTVIPSVPELTIQVARAAFPKGNPYLTLHEALGTIFNDEDFAPLYPERGQPSLSPWRLALVTILQFRENLTDRQAAEAVRARIDWKCFLALELTDPGFDFSVLSEFRDRLRVGGAEAILLDKLLGRCRELGLVKARGKQRTDSTRVLAAIRVLNRLELVAETQRLLGSLFLTSLEQAAFSRSDVQSSHRRPFFCMLDEFPLFCSRDSTALARILSECRKYRLHLGLAHQTITQLPNERIQGALENAKLKVVFGTGRQTAESIVKELFMPNLQAVKHEVKDSEAQERTHPVFHPLQEQFEGFVQKIQKQQRQHVLVKLPEREAVIDARTPVVPPSRIDAATLEQWKRYLARQRGKACAELEAEIAERTQRLGLPTMQPAATEAAVPAARTVTVDDDIWQPIRDPPVHL